MRKVRRKSICELGPIRPPSESTSLLIRVTRNCPWNRCLFCPVYKERRFEKRSVSDVIGEINLLHQAAERLRDRIADRESGSPTGEKQLLDVVRDAETHTYEERRMALWFMRGDGHVFLQDADSLIRPVEKIVPILEHIRRRFPEASRITTYARSRTLAVKSPKQLETLKKAGLRRIHVGLESGSDEVLDLVQKGCRSTHHIAGIRKAVEAGFEVCCYVMPGLGGRALSDVHCRETARVLREINPRHIRLRTMFLTDGIPLHEKVRSGEMQLLEEEEVVQEIRALIDMLRGIDGEVVSDHDHNLLTHINGHLTDDADMLDTCLATFIDLPKEARDAFVAARRSGRLRSLDAFLTNPALVAEMTPLVASLKSAGNGSLLRGMLTRFSPRLF